MSTQPSLGLPSGFDPYRPAGELTSNIERNAPKELFIVNKTVQVRVVALLSLLPSLVLTKVFLSINVPMLLIFPMGFCAASVWMWIKAPSVPRRELPDRTSWQGPNRYSSSQLFVWLLVSTMLLALSAYALQAGEFLLPTKHGRSILLKGPSLWNAALSLICASASMVTRVIDHFDTRNNEILYEYIAVGATWFSWTFFFACVLSLFMQI